jgi:hypothetical protein
MGRSAAGATMPSVSSPIARRRITPSPSAACGRWASVTPTSTDQHASPKGRAQRVRAELRVRQARSRGVRGRAADSPRPSGVEWEPFGPSCTHSGRSVVGSSRHWSSQSRCCLGGPVSGLSLTVIHRDPARRRSPSTSSATGGTPASWCGVPTSRRRRGPSPAGSPPHGFWRWGWGDRAFYESPDAGVRLALTAAFASEASVLHVAGFDRTPAEYFPRAEIIVIELPRAAWKR